MRKCIFILSVDTEEEWDWKGPFPTQDVSVDNVQQIPNFHRELANLGVRPTYFLDYAVLENSESRECLQALAKQNQDFEFGAHLHPWVTPPKTEIVTEADSHIVNLPIAIVDQQIDHLTQAIESHFSIKPKAFRSGRWGINDEILKSLLAHGYQVDSSVYPYYKNGWFDCSENSSQPHWIKPEDSNKDIFELPITAGFNVKNFKKANSAHQLLENSALRFLRPIGLLWKLNLFKKIYLSPELSEAKDMIQLCKRTLENDLPVIHMYLHSSSLLPRATGYVKNRKAKAELTYKISQTVNYLKQHYDVQMCTISEAAKLISQDGKK